MKNKKEKKTFPLSTPTGKGDSLREFYKNPNNAHVNHIKRSGAGGACPAYWPIGPA